MRALGVVAILAGALVMLADTNIATNAPLSLGGVAIGSSVLDVVKKLGMPNVVQTTDDGHFWQWAEAGGLDREVLTNDDLVVESVLVAEARAPLNAQPNELPVLGVQTAKAKTDVGASGAVPADRSGPTWSSYRWNGGVLVVETDGSTVVRLRAFDEATASMRGYFGTRPTVATHRAPVLVKQYEPAYVPAVNGTVIVRVEVDSKGKVTDARVIVPSGDRTIDRFEVASMLQSTFAPATCGGVPCSGVYLDIGWMSYD